MPLHRRLPKRGFRNEFKKHYTIVHLRDLERFEPNTVVDVDLLKKAGLVRQMRDGVKVLSDGEITRPVVLKVHKVSRKAKEKIEAAGGRVEEI
jgi:large subunit ribosomal protein L15